MHCAPDQVSTMKNSLLTVLLGALVLSACSSSSDDDGSSTADISMGVKPWDDQAEDEWTKWISEIGEARLAGKCIHLDDCINKSQINKLKKPTDADLDIFADCADVPMELRAYFAIQTGRPFQY